MAYSASGMFFMQAESLEDVVKHCKGIMRLTPHVGNMDVYKDNSLLCGTLSREVIYTPAPKKTDTTAPDAPGVSFSPGA